MEGDKRNEDFLGRYVFTYEVGEGGAYMIDNNVSVV